MSRPLIWRYFKRRAAGDPRYGLHLDERRGQGAPFAAQLWVHAVSLGEMKSAEPLIADALADGLRVLTTHATPAGRHAAETRFAADIASGQMAVRYVPVDLPIYWDRFFARHTPQVGLAMEMEFWPNMIERAARHDVKLCLANSQVPEKSFPRAQRLAHVFGHPVARAAHVFAKSDRMADRFRTLGAGSVSVSGETRFDIAPPARLVEAGQRIAHRPVITLASVVAGEEPTYLKLVQDLLTDPNPPLIFWVPRAPELFEASFDMLRDAGLKVAKRSQVFDDDLIATESLDVFDVIVGDSLGEMFFYLAPAQAVVVGGGFVENGAHNVIEPLSLGKPVVTGPHVWTIEFPGVEAEEAGVLTVCRDPQDLAQTVRQAMASGGPAAAAFHATHRGASARIFDAIRPYLEQDT